MVKTQPIGKIINNLKEIKEKVENKDITENEKIDIYAEVQSYLGNIYSKEKSAKKIEEEQANPNLTVDKLKKAEKIADDIKEELSSEYEGDIAMDAYLKNNAEK